MRISPRFANNQTHYVQHPPGDYHGASGDNSEIKIIEEGISPDESMSTNNLTQYVSKRRGLNIQQNNRSNASIGVKKS